MNNELEILLLLLGTFIMPLLGGVLLLVDRGAEKLIAAHSTRVRQVIGLGQFVAAVCFVVAVGTLVLMAVEVRNATQGWGVVVGNYLGVLMLLTASAVCVGWVGVRHWQTYGRVAKLLRSPDKRIGSTILLADARPYCLILILWFVLITFSLTLLVPLAGVAALMIFVLLSNVSLASHRSELMLWLAMAAENRVPLVDQLARYEETLRGRPRLHVEQLRMLLENGSSLADGLQSIPALANQSVAVELAAAPERASQILREYAVRSFGGRSEPGYSIPATYFLAFGCLLLLLIQLPINFVNYYIVPKYKRILQDFNLDEGDVYDAWAALVGSSNNLIVLVAIPAVLALYCGVRLALRSSVYSNGPPLNVPYLRWAVEGMTLPIARSRILRSLRWSVLGKEPLPDAMVRISYSYPHHLLRKRMMHACDLVEGGAGTWESLTEAGLISIRDFELLKSADRSGNLAWALQFVANRMDRELGDRSIKLVEFLRPLIILLIGVPVILFAFQCFLPLIEMIRRLVPPAM